MSAYSLQFPTSPWPVTIAQWLQQLRLSHVQSSKVLADVEGSFAPTTTISEIQAQQVSQLPASEKKPAVIRVLQVVNGEHYAGAERVQDLLALSLPKQQVQVGFACVKPNRFPDERQCQKTPLWSIAMSNRIDLRPVWSLVKLIHHEQIQILHSHNARAALIAALAAWWTNIPFVHHVHGQTQVEVGQRWWTRCNAWLEQQVLKRASAIIAVSQSVAASIPDSVGCYDKTFVIPNGVPAVTIPKKLCPLSIPTVGFIAWLRPRKGLETLLESASLLKRAGRPCRLRIVGRFDDPAYEQEIKKLARDYQLEELIDWRGFCQNVAAELATMDLLAFPSILPEGMPMVVLEALSMGVPVIGSRVAGVTDVIQHERNGWLVEPQNSVDLAEAITTLGMQPKLWQQLRQAGIDSHREHYSDQVMAQRVAALYRRVIEQQTQTDETQHAE
jgi:glycosyltransferase involved in cell wall biosynthesis